MPASRGMAARVILALLFAAGLLAAALVFFPAPQTRSLLVSGAALPSGIPATGPVPATREACEAFGGIYNPEEGGFCLGIANPNLAAFCRIGPPCEALFGRVRDCNLLNRRGGGYAPAPAGCGAACPEGSAARGNQCVAAGGTSP